MLSEKISVSKEHISYPTQMKYIRIGECREEVGYLLPRTGNGIWESESIRDIDLRCDKNILSWL